MATLVWTAGLASWTAAADMEIFAIAQAAAVTSEPEPVQPQVSAGRLSRVVPAPAAPNGEAQVKPDAEQITFSQAQTEFAAQPQPAVEPAVIQPAQPEARLAQYSQASQQYQSAQTPAAQSYQSAGAPAYGATPVVVPQYAAEAGWSSAAADCQAEQNLKQSQLEPQAIQQPTPSAPSATQQAESNLPLSEQNPQPVQAQPMTGPTALACRSEVNLSAIKIDPADSSVPHQQPFSDDRQKPKFGTDNRHGLIAELDAIPTPAATKAQASETPSKPGRLSESLSSSMPKAPSAKLSESLNTAAAKTPQPKMFVDPTSSSTHKALGSKRSVSGRSRQIVESAGDTRSNLIYVLNRSAARSIDLTLFAVPGFILYLIVVSLTALATQGNIDKTVLTVEKAFMTLVLVGISLAAEVVVLSIWGTTPGKKLLRLQLIDTYSGQPLTKEKALERTLWLYVYVGLVAVWIPFFIGYLATLAGAGYQIYRLMNSGATNYDARVSVRCEPLE